MTYLWLKALHIIGMVCWFAALFYLPRLFVYHAMADDQVSRDRFNTMQRKLYRGIATPAAIITIFFGLWMMALHFESLRFATWLKIKLILVFFLIIYHYICGYYVKQFALNRVTKSHTYFRFFNEIPVLFLGRNCNTCCGQTILKF